MSKNIAKHVVAGRVVCLGDVERPKNWNLRSEVDPAVIEALASSIRASNGLITPLTVEAKADGGYRLVSGYNRYAALLLICKEDNEKPSHYPVSVNVREYKTEAAALLANVTENAGRTDPHPADYGRRFDMLMQKPFECTSAAIANETTFSRSNINNLARAWRELPETIRTHWHEGDYNLHRKRTGEKNGKATIPLALLFKWAGMQGHAEMMVAYETWMKAEAPVKTSKGKDKDKGKKGANAAPTSSDIDAAIARYETRENPSPTVRGILAALNWVRGNTKRIDAGGK